MSSKILTLLFAIVLTISMACSKDESRKSIIIQEVTFSFDLVDPLGLKNEDPWNFDCPVDDDGNLLIPAVAEIEIRDENNILTTFYPLVFYLSGKLYTQAIKLTTGAYEVTKLLLLNQPAGTIIMATPSASGLFAQYVSKPVAYEFEVEAFRKIQLEAEVLCYSSEKVLEFGFFWFEVTEIVIRQFCFFGDICANGLPYAPTDFTGSDYENLTGGLMVDMPAIFKIHVYRTFNGQTTEMPHSPFTNLGNENQPLCLLYPDRIRVTGEDFSFELWILVPVDDGFDYVLYHTFTSTDGGPLSTSPGTDGIVDFVLGNCVYSTSDLQLNW